MESVQDHPQTRMMYYFFLLGFFAIFSTTVSKTPVLPLFSQALGADDALIGLIAFFSPLAGILFSFPIGVMSDHIGRKKILVLSGAIFLAAPFLYLLVMNPYWLIPIRFFHGTATAILGPLVSAIIAERFPARKAEMIGQYSSATLIGRTVAPLVGGAIISYFVFYPGLLQYRIVYIAAAAAAVPVFIMTLLYREKESGPLNLLPFSVFRDSFMTFFSNRRLRGTAFVDMATYFAFGAFETFLPILLASRGMSAYETGIIFAVQVLIIAATKPLFGRVADRVDKRVQILAGIVLTGVSIALVPFCQSFAQFLIVSSLFGLGISISTVATTAYIADVARKEQIGASMGALSSIMDIGQSTGPLVTGMVITAIGYTSGFFLSFMLAIVVSVLFVVSVIDHTHQ
ncbi:MAG: MFS transporter [Methanomicrobiales archaeon]|jgi:MFS family permease|nr:MFS transporter [Methanomicrobiales archaeon]OPY42414.1 MAG: drug efflux system protein MdtG [Methanoregulaceae archaeon PtaU1.Bin222]